MQLTDAVRAAVLAEQCTELGHDFTIIKAITGDGMPGGGAPRMILGTDGDRDTPHLLCTRCARVWLVLEDGAASIEEAEAALVARLPAGDVLTTRVAARIARRGEPAAAAAPSTPYGTLPAV